MNKVKDLSPAMSIGTLAKQSGIGIEAIRYYERRGLLSAVSRKSSGYRVFNGESLKALRFLKSAQELGFTLEEIKDLLKLRASKSTSCDVVKVRASKHLSEVESKIQRLEKIRDVLSELIKKCQKRKTSEVCPILDCFDQGD